MGLLMSLSVPPPSSTSRLAFPGAVLAGRYRLEEIVGAGGMGAVWRAIHIGLGEQVAVKLVSATFVRSSEALRRFDTEAKSAARIRSRHVPQVFDNGVLEDGTPYLVMELLHGESLAARVNRLGPIPLPEAMIILEQCCRALTRAHSLGIVHRDIKPENVYLAQSVDDDGYIAKVLDFGIAKVTSLTDDARSSTRTGTLLGTPLYMSPEQARGLRSIDFRTDVYSLGLVAYTMLTARLPFSGETLGELLLQICVEPLPRLRAAAPGLPMAVEHWFQKACARLPEDRFSSAQALVEALRVAAGISSPSQVDSVSGEGPFMPVAPAGDGEQAAQDPAAAVGALPVPSTTGGTALRSIATTNRRARWVAMSGAAILGLAVAPVVVLFALGRKSPAVSPAVEVATAPATAASAAKPDAGSSVSVAPLVFESASTPGPFAPFPATLPGTADRPAATAAHPAPRPVASTAPPPGPSITNAKPAATSRPPTKPGAIDLGY
jgi:serine/threonine-protein kinase